MKVTHLLSVFILLFTLNGNACAAAFASRELRLGRDDIMFIKMTTGLEEIAELYGVNIIRDDRGDKEYEALKGTDKASDSGVAAAGAGAKKAPDYNESYCTKIADIYSKYKETLDFDLEWALLSEASKGSPLAESFAAFMYQLGLGRIVPDPERAAGCAKRALPWLEAEAAKGNVFASCNLGWFYHNGLGVERDRAKAIKIWFPLDTPENLKKYPGIGYTLYWMYMEMSAHPMDEPRLSKVEDRCPNVVRVLTIAAESENLPAQELLVTFYQKGFGEIMPDAAKAAHWQEKLVAGSKAFSGLRLRFEIRD